MSECPEEVFEEQEEDVSRHGCLVPTGEESEGADADGD